MIGNFVIEGFTFEQVMTDDEALEAFVRKAAIGVWHASCTCRMGRDGDPMAVTDTQGRVRGVQGLRVVDASIFPLVPCANTNFPTLMTAEKIADAILCGDSKRDLIRSARPPRARSCLCMAFEGPCGFAQDDNGGEHAMSVILGSGEHRYEVIENWAKLPDGWEFKRRRRGRRRQQGPASTSSIAASTR